MKKSNFFTCLLILIIASNSLFSQKKNKIVTENFLVGTYTDTDSQGINLIQFDSKTKQLSLKSVVATIGNPSFVIANKAKTIVVAGKLLSVTEIE